MADPSSPGQSPRPALTSSEAAQMPADLTPLQQEIWPFLSLQAQKFVTTISYDVKWGVGDYKDKDITEIFPEDIRGSDLQITVDFLYCIKKNYRLPLVSDSGEFLHSRHPLNDRGDRATVNQRR